MTIATLILLLIALGALAHFGGIASLLLRPLRAERTEAGRPPVTVLRPACGLENNIEATLASSFSLNYPAYEVIFCVARADDPVIPLIRRLIAGHGERPARLLIGDDRISINPKLNNVVKGWNAAHNNWIVMADSNVLLPADAIDRMLRAWTADAGLVCSPPVGTAPEGAGADLECAFLNSFLARWELIGDEVGFAFALGKTMLWRRSDLDAAGGITALAAGPAEDTSATKVIRASGKRVRLVAEPFMQPLGRRTFGEVWHRQVRWARLQRAGFPVVYALQGTAGGTIPLGLAAALAALGAFPPAWFMLFLLAWYGAEVVLALRFGWPISLRIVAFLMVRDLLLPALWVAGWTGSRFTWRGNAMDIGEADGRDPLRRLVGQVRRARVVRLLSALGLGRRPVGTDWAGHSRRDV